MIVVEELVHDVSGSEIIISDGCGCRGSGRVSGSVINKSGRS